MEWLFLAGLGIIWAASLAFPGSRRGSPSRGVEEFERTMDLLARTQRPRGRWVIAPQRGTPFLGPRSRARARARERRRRVFAFLLEAIGLTFLIGLFPPLRAMWVATGVLAALLGTYVWLLLQLKQGGGHVHARRALEVAAAPSAHRSASGGLGGNGHTPRYVGRGRAPRPAYNGLGSLGEGDLVHVVVRLPEEVESLRA